MDIKIFKTKEKISNERISGIHTIIMTALECNMTDVIYNTIITWKWFNAVCQTESADDLIELLNQSKKCEDFDIYTDWNNPKKFNVYDNMRDIIEMNNRFDVLDMI